MNLNDLIQFLQLAHRFRRTPIVDDDFPGIRNEFDRELDRMIGLANVEAARRDRDPPPLTFEQLRLVNVARQREHFKGCRDWTLSDWALAMVGEAGEACNVVKKLNRNDGTGTPEAVVEELADVIIYADILAAKLGQDLGEAVRRKFNLVSERIGANHKL